MANAKDIKYLEYRANMLLQESDKIEKWLEMIEDDPDRISKLELRLKLVNAKYDILWDIVAHLGLESRYNAKTNNYTITKRK